MIPKPAQYLLRIDDLCPTSSPEGWSQCTRLIKEFALRPILAIVPDNRDLELECSEPDPGFWDRMSALEAAGAAVALHGYQHVCTSIGPSLLGLHRSSEFAGVDIETQRSWTRTGLRILKGHGLTPRLWVAPRHGFDRNTLRVLREEGLPYLCDGFQRAPYVRGGVTWIPQQLWAPRERTSGLWTICLHPNTAKESDFAILRAFLQLHADQFTCFHRVIASIGDGNLSFAERAYARLVLWRVQLRNARRRGVLR
jgi:predicted deacetylase